MSVARGISCEYLSPDPFLQSLLLPVRYPSSFFTQLLLLPGRICLIAHDTADANTPVAFISACLRQSQPADHLTYLSHDLKPPLCESPDPAHWIEILTLGVLPEYQKRGIASLLVRRVYEYFRASLFPASHLNDGTMVRANVATSNVSALSFYKRLGMRIVSDVISNLYRTCSYGSRDAYLVSGFLYFSDNL